MYLIKGMSVTKRIEEVHQPFKGYVQTDLFKQEEYDDGLAIEPLETGLESIQGLAVDYLTRFKLIKNVEEAFDIPILGARQVDLVMENDKEENRLKGYLSKINGLDDESIINACKATGYDVAIRLGVKYFVDVETIKPTKQLINNIKLLVERSEYFLSNNGPIIKTGFTFEDGYTNVVSSGDGDYLSKDTIWDFKCSKNDITTKHTLQLLMYYLLGYHSKYPEFKNVTKLGIYNPILNKAYVAQISDIKPATLYEVSNSVLGYKMVKKRTAGEDAWKEVNGTDEEILIDVVSKQFVDTGFDSSKYEDGIHDISVDDYWTYIRKEISFLKPGQYLRMPLFKDIEKVIFLKKNGYKMFVAQTEKGVLSILHKGARKNLDYPIEYYYEHLDQYAELVKKMFSPYWNALYAASKALQEIEPDEAVLRKNFYSDYVQQKEKYKVPIMPYEEWYEKLGKYKRLEGKVHGCIVDLDTLNHIYINPKNGQVQAYNAKAKYDRDHYQNLPSLLAAKRPEMLNGYVEKVKTDSALLLIDKGEDTGLVVNDFELAISDETEKVYSTDMYEISDKLVRLQPIYDFNLVTVWNDLLISQNRLEG